MNESYEQLAEHTTLKIGGEARILIPESKDELISTIDQLNQSGEEFKILGGGSNILVTDQGEIDFTVIKTTRCCGELSVEGNDVSAGASVMMPKLSHFLVQNGLGGIEYLYSVPGTVGGGLFMNAGRGGNENVISNYLVSVELYDGTKTRVIPRSDLTFGNRYSTFQEKPEWVILSAHFKFPDQPTEVGEKLLEERMDKVSDKERSLPNAGSTFLIDEGLIQIVPEFVFRKIMRCGDARYAHKNRFVNEGDASFDEMMTAINRMMIIHNWFPFTKDLEFEWRVWK